MKLTNREIAVIASKIKNQIDEKFNTEVKTWEEKEFPEILKRLKKTSIYLQIGKMLSYDFIKSISVKRNNLRLNGFLIEETPYDKEITIDSLENFNKIILGQEKSNFRKNKKTITFEQIENDVILEAIGNSDIDNLIEKIALKY